jgi:hypothetical protein
MRLIDRHRTLRLLPLLGALTLLTACASMAVSDDAIVTNTARALGLNKTEFTISDRADSGVQTTYTVRTKAGKSFSCYVTGTVSVTGRIVSDAVCTEMAGAGAGTAKPPSTPPKDPNCNALLRAAGRCT